MCVPGDMNKNYLTHLLTAIIINSGYLFMNE